MLVPARNAEATLPAALRSIQAQLHADFEAVIVDDGSTDDTAGRVEHLARRDPRFRLVVGPGEGIVGALNRGLAACEAPLVARFDADDLMHRDRLSLQTELLGAHPELHGAGALVTCFPRRTLRDGMRRYEAWLNGTVSARAIWQERFVEAPLVHPSMTLRRDVLVRAGGWHDSAWAEDWDLWLRLLEHGPVLGKVARRLHLWRDGAARLTRTDPRYAPERMVEARAHYLVRGPLSGGREAVIWGAGPVGKALMKALDRVGACVVALVDIDPRKIGQVVHGRRVLAPSGLGRGPVLLAGVGAAGARDDIRREALARGFVEGEDFFACA